MVNRGTNFAKHKAMTGGCAVGPGAVGIAEPVMCLICIFGATVSSLQTLTTSFLFFFLIIIYMYN